MMPFILSGVEASRDPGFSAESHQRVALSPRYKWVALSVTTLGTFMVAIDTSIVVLALPTILHDFKADLTIATWAVNAYALVLTIFLIPFGRMGDMHGRVRLYNIGFSVFTIGSGVAAFAPTGLVLILGRIVQGLGGTLLIANSQPIVVDAFPAKERGRGLGMQIVAFSVGSVSGYMLGGLLIPLGGWRSIFTINLPVGVFATYWGWHRLRELTNIRPNRKHDPLGGLLLAVGLTGLLLTGTLGSSEGWAAPVTLGTAALGLVAIPFFVYVEQRVKDPLLNPRLLRHRPFAVGVTATYLNSFAFTGLPFVLIFYLQSLRNLSPEAAALVLIPLVVSATSIGPVSGYLADRWGPRAPATGGLVLMSLGLYAFALLPLPAPEHYVMILLAITGLGAGFFFAPNTSAILGAVPASYRGVAAATRSTLVSLGRVSTIAFISIILAQNLPPVTLTAILNGENLSGNSAAMLEFLTSFRIILVIFATINVLAGIISAFRGSASLAEYEIA